MKKSWDTIVIGGGIIGCATAFELAKRGVKDILLIERKCITSGNTGRCGSGIRLQWGSSINTKLAVESMETFEHMEEYTGYNHSCGLNQVGYLLIATDDSEWDMLKSNLDLQHKMGVDSFIVDMGNDVQKIAPGINIDGIVGATFCQRDGNADPFHCTLAYLQGAKRLGVEVLTYTTVTELIAKNGKIKGVKTTRGEFGAERVINCANVWGVELAEQVGDKIPIFAERHQAFISEPLAPMGANGRGYPMVMSWKWMFFLQQTLHGSFIGGAIEANPVSSEQLSSDFLLETGHILTKVLPFTRNLRVLRQWQGYFDNSPDHTPIINFSRNAEGLVNMCGFSGHGFMIAPRISIMLARYLCDEDDTIDINKFRLERYEAGDVFVESTVHSVDIGY